jgi:hypothetical protein
MNFRKAFEGMFGREAKRRAAADMQEFMQLPQRAAQRLNGNGPSKPARFGMNLMLLMASIQNLLEQRHSRAPAASQTGQIVGKR